MKQKEITTVETKPLRNEGKNWHLELRMKIEKKRKEAIRNEVYVRTVFLLVFVCFKNKINSVHLIEIRVSTSLHPIISLCVRVSEWVSKCVSSAFSFLFLRCSMQFDKTKHAHTHSIYKWQTTILKWEPNESLNK